MAATKTREERTITCPHCQHEQTTRAYGGLLTTCKATSCGQPFKVPPKSAAAAPAGVVAEHHEPAGDRRGDLVAEHQAPAPDVDPAPPASAGDVDGDQLASGLRIRKATATRVVTAPPPAEAPVVDVAAAPPAGDSTRAGVTAGPVAEPPAPVAAATSTTATTSAPRRAGARSHRLNRNRP